MAQAQPESMFDPTIRDAAASAGPHAQQRTTTTTTGPGGNAWEQQQQAGAEDLAQEFANLGFSAAAGGQAAAAGLGQADEPPDLMDFQQQEQQQQQQVEDYFDKLQDIIEKEQYTNSSTVVHVAHRAQRKEADLTHSETICQTQVHVEAATGEQSSSTHDLLLSDAVIKAHTPFVSLTGHVSDTQLQVNSVFVVPPPPGLALDPYPCAPLVLEDGVPDDVMDAAFSPPLPGAGGDPIAPDSDDTPPAAAAPPPASSSPLMSGDRDSLLLSGTGAATTTTTDARRLADHDVPPGAMENGAFHGEEVDADLTYPVTPDGILAADQELEMQRNITLDAIQASYVDLSSFAYPEPGERDAVEPLEGTRSIIVDSGQAPPGADPLYSVPGTAYPQGGNYVLTKDSAPFAGPDFADLAFATLAAAEAEEDPDRDASTTSGQAGTTGPGLAEGDFALGGGGGGGGSPQAVQAGGYNRPPAGTVGARPGGHMVDLKHLDDHLAKQEESAQIDRFLKQEQADVRQVDDLLISTGEGHGRGGRPDAPRFHTEVLSSPKQQQQQQLSGASNLPGGGGGADSPQAMMSPDERKDSGRPMPGALDDTRFAGAEETLPTEPAGALSSVADVELHVGPSPKQGREIADTLEEAGIIPDVLDKFISTTRMNISYNGGQPMKNGSKLKEHDVAAQPEIVIEGAFVMPGSTYAVALVDVDVKRAVDGERQERLLWLQIGIPGPQDMGSTGMVARGTNLVEYEAPTAKGGDDTAHRYLYVLFKHKNTKFKVPADREAFSCRLFAAVHDIIPIAAINFTVV